jgi:hypothetical protein
LFFGEKIVYKSTTPLAPTETNNPLEMKAYFFLVWQSDLGSSCPDLRKKGFHERDYGGRRE